GGRRPRPLPAGDVDGLAGDQRPLAGRVGGLVYPDGGVGYLADVLAVVAELLPLGNRVRAALAVPAVADPGAQVRLPVHAPVGRALWQRRHPGVSGAQLDHVPASSSGYRPVLTSQARITSGGAWPQTWPRPLAGRGPQSAV